MAELEHVPTVPELARQGLAEPDPHTRGVYRLSPEGQAVITAAIRRNVERMRADPTLDPHRNVARRLNP